MNEVTSYQLINRLEMLGISTDLEDHPGCRVIIENQTIDGVYQMVLIPYSDKHGPIRTETVEPSDTIEELVELVKDLKDGLAAHEVVRAKIEARQEKEFQDALLELGGEEIKSPDGNEVMYRVGRRVFKGPDMYKILTSYRNLGHPVYDSEKKS